MTERDYLLSENNQALAASKGLADADWYRSPINKAHMNALLERKNFPAIRDTIIWFGLLLVSGYLGAVLWPSPWAILPFMVYGVVYATSSDSRWHESSHGTAFKTDWMNVVLYEIASFMVARESTVWRWSHFRHHSDTLVVGRDPEIAAQRPTSYTTLLSFFTGLPSAIAILKSLFLHARGKLTTAEALFIPETEHHKVYQKARIYISIYASVIGLALYLNSWLPIMFVGLPTLYGAWLMPIYGLTQHTALAENQLDHRLNCRTVYMNLVNRFLYWNMGYHVEHHMYPMVPYYNLPKLHELIKADCPKPYPSLWSAWREIIPALKKQQQDISYFVRRELPKTAHHTGYRQGTIAHFSTGNMDAQGWIQIDAQSPKVASAIRFDHAQHSYAIYRTNEGALYATDGICTHGNAHLAEGLVCGKQIECPKHNGRFDISDGSCQRQPVTIPIQTYGIQERADGTLWFKLPKAEQPSKKAEKTTFTVVSNRLVTPFIKELILVPDTPNFKFRAGDFIQLDIPPYTQIGTTDFAVPPLYASQWQDYHCQAVVASHDTTDKRNYSIANAPQDNGYLCFNVRIALPPQGTSYPMGTGSAYVFSLKPGNKVTAGGPSGSFHIQHTDKEMIYIGGGAGMAPIRAHISHLFEIEKTPRKVSYWYGARTRQDIFYQDYFTQLAVNNRNFSYVVALSEEENNDSWQGPCGYIHQILENQYLAQHPNPQQAEYYLCGPPMMIAAVETLLQKYGVPQHAICYDIF